jgi:hypothetical protein
MLYLLVISLEQLGASAVHSLLTTAVAGDLRRGLRPCEDRGGPS